MANSVDFRADQVQVNKVIVTGSNAGSQNALLVYGLDKQTSPLNQGYIDQAKFSTGSIGSDVFLYVSGGIGGRGISGGAISVFGGDLHISGNVSAQGNLFVQGNSQFTGSAFFAGGNVTLGDTTADIVTVNAQMTASNLRATGSFSGSFTGTFPATVPTVTTNTWAPTLTFAGGGGTSQTKVGTYVKIGQLVIANFSITRTTGTAGSGTVTLTALPFTSQTTTGVAGSIVVSNFQNVVSGPRVISGVVNSNATTATMYFMDTGAADMSLLTGAELTSTTILQGTITYIAAS